MEPVDGPESPVSKATPCDSNSSAQASETTLSSPLRSAPAGVPDPELPMLYCPVCSQRLASRKCKLFCERCGYYMSCADYY
jgi:hypothetical protein